MNILIDKNIKKSIIDSISDTNNISMACNSNIIDEIKQKKSIIVITNDEESIKKIMGSISINTSTYIITEKQLIGNNIVNLKNNNNINDIIKQIEDSRIPSVEKIWNRNYSDEQLNLSKEFPKMTQNDYVRTHNIDKSFNALDYFGVKTTYEDYDKDIRKYAGIFYNLGVREGDYVSFCMPNTPEFIKIRYALDELGAVANFIDPRVDSEKMKHCLNMVPTKLLFILDSRYKDLAKIIDKTNLNQVYLLTPFECLPKLSKGYNLLQQLKGNRPDDSGYKYFKDFDTMNSNGYIKPKYTSNRTTSIQYTSGTTGMPKAVEISDDSYNARVFQYHFTDIDLSKQHRLLQALPISGLAFGEFSMQMGLCNGMENVIVPTFTPDGLAKIIDKQNVNALVMPPLAWYGIIKSPRLKKMDLSNLTMCAVGGESMTEAKVNEVNEALISRGCKRHVITGGGCTEAVVSHCTETNAIEKPGSVGIPLIGNNVSILDGNGKELSYNERGTVVYKTVYPMNGYIGNEELTNSVKTDRGINLNDIGYIDDSGMITILGREKDLIKIDNLIVYPRDIEEKIMKLPLVDFCTVVQDDDNKVRIFFTMKDCSKYNELYDNILSIIGNEFSIVKNLVKIIALNKMPYTKNCKTDREKLAKEEINNLDIYTKNSKIKIFKKR